MRYYILLLYRALRIGYELEGKKLLTFMTMILSWLKPVEMMHVMMGGQIPSLCYCY